MDTNRFSKTMGGGTKEKPVSHWGKGAPRFRTKSFWTDALKWNASAQVDHDAYNMFKLGVGLEKAGPGPSRPCVFPSLCDVLDDEVPIEWLADFLGLIHDTPHLDWLLLTKRPGRFTYRLEAVLARWIGGAYSKSNWLYEWLGARLLPPNVKVGVSVENQNYANIRIRQLLAIPAQVRFLSVEPLLEPVKLGLNEINYDRMCHGGASTKPYISWVIVGGESSKQRRDCGVEAIIDVAQQGQAAGCAVHVKQDCAYAPGQQGRIPNDIWKLKAPCP